MAQSARMDVVAQNLANLLTPGYRRARPAFRQALADAMAMPGAPLLDGVRIDDNPGPYERTGRPLDFAVRSRGCFCVRDLSTAAVRYTRAGRFAVDAQGRLVTADGKSQVLDENGDGVTLDVERAAEVRLLSDGTLFQGDREVGRLWVADFPDPSALRPVGDGLYEYVGPDGPSAPAERRLEQGILEGSAADPVADMAEMTRAVRALETNLQMLRIQDALLDRAINELGRLPR